MSLLCAVCLEHSAYDKSVALPVKGIMKSWARAEIYSGKKRLEGKACPASDGRLLADRAFRPVGVYTSPDQ